jgi:hypothetical protein
MKNMNGKQGGQGKMAVHGGQYQTNPMGGLTLLDNVVLTDDATASLRYMIQEEKLAGDLYETFADQTGLRVFDRIAAAEDKHMNALINLAEKAGINVTDLIALPAGKFADAALQTMYDNLLATGSASTDAALAVGRAVELADIADLAAAMDSYAEPALVGVYGNLLAGSEHHLAAFDSWLLV